MLAIVMVAAAGALEAPAVGLAVAVAVPVSFSGVEVLDPPHAVANAATRHMAAQNNPNLFIVTPLDWTLGRDTIIDPHWFNEDQIHAFDGLCGSSEVAVDRRPHTIDGVVACRIDLVGQRIMANYRVGIAPTPIRIRFADAFSAKPPTTLR
jgi:hypothetical protein